MPMPAYHPNFITSCQFRRNALLNLLRCLKEAEINARRWPSASNDNTVDFHADRLADFMYRNCGFPKGEPAPVPRYVQPSFEQAQRWFNDTISSIPLRGMNQEPRA